MEANSIIVVGGSAGSVNPLMTLVGCFAEDLPAAVFVAIHTAPEARSHLPQILSRAGPLEARHAVDGDKIEAGRIYVAPPDHHLIVGPDHLHLSRGPRENGHRPAIDPMFRSAARSFGPGVTGVVLSGAADDGAAGLVAIKSAGGVAVAQEPREAMHPSMPESAVAAGAVDLVLGASDLGAYLMNAAGRKIDRSSVRPRALADAADLAVDDPRLVPTGYACPDCSGGLFEIEGDEVSRFRCRIGHAYSPRSLEAQQAKSVETALWTAVRALEERASLLLNLSERLRKRGGERSADRMASEAAHARSEADHIRDFLLRGSLAVLEHDSSGRTPEDELAEIMPTVGSSAELEVYSEEQQRPQDYGKTG